jgi:hypothetical protein
MKKLIVFGMFLCGAFSAYMVSLYLHERAVDQARDGFTFSNTQTWDLYLQNKITGATSTSDSVLPPPPKNTSRETKRELEELHKLQKERTDAHIAEINQEVFTEDTYFGDEVFSILVSSSTRPFTYQLFSFMSEVEVGIIMREKAIWNRVRPSYLDSTLSPVLEVPAHPSYPSGHATQAYLRAYVLGELDPAHKDAYITSAERITHNREIAGLHFKSDSEAGTLLAEYIFKELKKDFVFFELLQSSKTEW